MHDAKWHTCHPLIDRIPTSAAKIKQSPTGQIPQTAPAPHFLYHSRLQSYTCAMDCLAACQPKDFPLDPTRFQRACHEYALCAQSVVHQFCPTAHNVKGRNVFPHLRCSRQPSPAPWWTPSNLDHHRAETWCPACWQIITFYNSRRKERTRVSNSASQHTIFQSDLAHTENLFGSGGWPFQSPTCRLLILCCKVLRKKLST